MSLIEENTVVAADPVRVSRWPHVLSRATSTSLAVLGVAQAVFAGSFLNGNYESLMMHSVLGMSTVAFAIVQVIAVVFLRRAGGPRPVLLLGLALPLLLGVQIALGMNRLVGLHVPFGVLVIMAMLGLAVAVWRTPMPNGAAA